MKKFQNICDQLFLELPNSLAFILNIDWFNPYKHVVGVIYLVIANLPCSERYKLENIIIVGIIPGPNEPKKHMNSFLKPMVDELLDLWEGCYIQTSSALGIVYTCPLCLVMMYRAIYQLHEKYVDSHHIALFMGVPNA